MAALKTRVRMPTRRIAHITLSMGQGGIENLILSLLDQLNRQLFSAEVICLEDEGELAEEVRQKGVPLHVFSRKPGLDFRLIWDLARLFRKQKFDVVHTHNQASHFYGCLAARLARVPVVINTEHSRHMIVGYKRRQLEKRLLAMLTDRMVSVSDELYQASIGVDGVPRKKCGVILNGVDINKFESASSPTPSRNKLNLPATARIVSIVARLHPIKNHALLIQAIGHVRECIPDILLIVIGDGEARNDLMKLADSLGLAEHILFLGNRRDIPELLHLSEVMVLCSKSEGLPLVLLEGMAAKRPVIITSGANRAGLIVHDRNGLVSKDDPIDLAEKIVQILSNKVDSQRMAFSAFDDVSARFSIAGAARTYETLYQKMLDNRNIF